MLAETTLSLAAPSQEIASGRYSLKFASSSREVEEALRLRFDIFNIELGEGLQSSFQDEMDRDEFDAQCHHLLVSDRNKKKIIGAYRMQTLEMAEEGLGFYSDSEFDLSEMPSNVLEQAVELGRACIHKDYRNSRVLFLLWRGLALYLSHTGKRYLFGCSSLTSQDPVDGWDAMSRLNELGALDSDIRIPPLREFQCPKPEAISTRSFAIPRLFQLYINYGAKVCSDPALDRRFKTVDFLTLHDVAGLKEQAVKMFFGDSGGSKQPYFPLSGET